jgi:hypothetical protein
MPRTPMWTRARQRSDTRSASRKYFYKPVELRDMKDILASLAELEKESDGVMDEIVEGLE